MFSFLKSKRTANIVISDYVIRIIEASHPNVDDLKLIEEAVIPDGIIENGKIVDDLQFFELLEELVKQWGLKNVNVRFYVPDSLIIMRDVDVDQNVLDEELKAHITMEIDHTIHFPFKNPVFDIYDVQPVEDTDKKRVTLLAAPEEEIIKYTEMFVDASLHPIAVDVQALGAYRYYYHYEQQEADNCLLFKVNLTSTNISIFSNDRLRFLRYQQLDLAAKNWESANSSNWSYTGEASHLQAQIEDQISELERIMNFYQYSLHQGTKAINHIILLGDYPDLSTIASRIESRFGIRVTIIKPQEINTAFIPALGLALKEDS